MGIVGFAALGLGAACVVPTAVTAAGGYAGWLAGPAVVGGLAEFTSLHLAVGVIVVRFRPGTGPAIVTCSLTLSYR